MNKKNQKLWWMVAVFVLLLGGAGLLYGRLSKGTEESRMLRENTTDAEQVETQETVPAPDFTVQDETGEEVKLSDYLGKPVVVNFWASWCGYCEKEMPDFDAVYQEQGEEVQFLMVNVTDGMRETKEKAEDFIEEGGYSFPVVYDVEQEAAAAYGAYSLPTTVFIDAEGNLVSGVRGALSRNVLEKGIQLILPSGASS